MRHADLPYLEEDASVRGLTRFRVGSRTPGAERKSCFCGAGNLWDGSLAALWDSWRRLAYCGLASDVIGHSVKSLVGQCGFVNSASDDDGADEACVKCDGSFAAETGGVALHDPGQILDEGLDLFGDDVAHGGALASEFGA